MKSSVRSQTVLKMVRKKTNFVELLFLCHKNTKIIGLFPEIFFEFEVMSWLALLIPDASLTFHGL